MRCPPVPPLQALLFRLLTTLILAVLLEAPTTTTAPVGPSEDGIPGGCFYQLNYYAHGERVRSREPCLNCTCVDESLHCDLHICPFRRPLASRCIITEEEGQCCPTITCPPVPVFISGGSVSRPVDPSDVPVEVSSTPRPGELGCVLEDEYFAEGAQLPSEGPCEHCYCIRNHSACVMENCTLQVDGCRPVYAPGACCPVSYDCEEDDVPITSPTTTTTTTVKPAKGCMYNDTLYVEGSPIPHDDPCKHCYCMSGESICAVQTCTPPVDGCVADDPEPGNCCSSRYHCPTVTTEESIHFTQEDRLGSSQTEIEQNVSATLSPDVEIQREGASSPSSVESTEQVDDAITEKEGTTTERIDAPVEVVTPIVIKDTTDYQVETESLPTVVPPSVESLHTQTTVAGEEDTEQQLNETTKFNAVSEDTKIHTEPITDQTTEATTVESVTSEQPARYDGEQQPTELPVSIEDKSTYDAEDISTSTAISANISVASQDSDTSSTSDAETTPQEEVPQSQTLHPEDHNVESTSKPQTSAPPADYKIATEQNIEAIAASVSTSADTTVSVSTQESIISSDSDSVKSSLSAEDGESKEAEITSSLDTSTIAAEVEVDSHSYTTSQSTVSKLATPEDDVLHGQTVETVSMPSAVDTDNVSEFSSQHGSETTVPDTHYPDDKAGDLASASSGSTASDITTFTTEGSVNLDEEQHSNGNTTVSADISETFAVTEDTGISHIAEGTVTERTTPSVEHETEEYDSSHTAAANISEVGTDAATAIDTVDLDDTSVAGTTETTAAHTHAGSTPDAYENEIFDGTQPSRPGYKETTKVPEDSSSKTEEPTSIDEKISSQDDLERQGDLATETTTTVMSEDLGSTQRTETYGQTDGTGTEQVNDDAITSTTSSVVDFSSSELSASQHETTVGVEDMHESTTGDPSTFEQVLSLHHSFIPDMLSSPEEAGNLTSVVPMSEQTSPSPQETTVEFEPVSVGTRFGMPTKKTGTEEDDDLEETTFAPGSTTHSVHEFPVKSGIDDGDERLSSTGAEETTVLPVTHSDVSTTGELKEESATTHYPFKETSLKPEEVTAFDDSKHTFSTSAYDTAEVTGFTEEEDKVTDATTEGSGVASIADLASTVESQPSDVTAASASVVSELPGKHMSQTEASPQKDDGDDFSVHDDSTTVSAGLTSSGDEEKPRTEVPTADDASADLSTTKHPEEINSTFSTTIGYKTVFDGEKYETTVTEAAEKISGSSAVVTESEVSETTLSPEISVSSSDRMDTDSSAVTEDFSSAQPEDSTSVILEDTTTVRSDVDDTLPDVAVNITGQELFLRRGVSNATAKPTTATDSSDTILQNATTEIPLVSIEESESPLEIQKNVSLLHPQEQDRTANVTDKAENEVIDAETTHETEEPGPSTLSSIWHTVTSTFWPTVIPTTESPKEGVPGEGTCFYEGLNYNPGQSIPPTHPCHDQCLCEDSIVTCTHVECRVPKESRGQNCTITHEPGHCCPTYNCANVSFPSRNGIDSASRVTSEAPDTTTLITDADTQTTDQISESGASMVTQSVDGEHLSSTTAESPSTAEGEREDGPPTDIESNTTISEEPTKDYHETSDLPVIDNLDQESKTTMPPTMPHSSSEAPDSTSADDDQASTQGSSASNETTVTQSEVKETFPSASQEISYDPSILPVSTPVSETEVSDVNHTTASVDLDSSTGTTILPELAETTVEYEDTTLLKTADTNDTESLERQGVTLGVEEYEGTLLPSQSTLRPVESDTDPDYTILPSSTAETTPSPATQHEAVPGVALEYEITTSASAEPETSTDFDGTATSVPELNMSTVLPIDLQETVSQHENGTSLPAESVTSSVSSEFEEATVASELDHTSVSTIELEGTIAELEETTIDPSKSDEVSAGPAELESSLVVPSKDEKTSITPDETEGTSVASSELIGETSVSPFDLEVTSAVPADTERTGIPLSQSVQASPEPLVPMVTTAAPSEDESASTGPSEVEGASTGPPEVESASTGPSEVESASTGPSDDNSSSLTPTKLEVDTVTPDLEETTLLPSVETLNTSIPSYEKKRIPAGEGEVEITSVATSDIESESAEVTESTGSSFTPSEEYVSSISPSESTEASPVVADHKKTSAGWSEVESSSHISVNFEVTSSDTPVSYEGTTHAPSDSDEKLAITESSQTPLETEQTSLEYEGTTIVSTTLQEHATSVDMLEAGATTAGKEEDGSSQKYESDIIQSSSYQPATDITTVSEGESTTFSSSVSDASLLSVSEAEATTKLPYPYSISTTLKPVVEETSSDSDAELEGTTSHQLEGTTLSPSVQTTLTASEESTQSEEATLPPSEQSDGKTSELPQLLEGTTLKPSDDRQELPIDSSEKPEEFTKPSSEKSEGPTATPSEYDEKTTVESSKFPDLATEVSSEQTHHPLSTSGDDVAGSTTAPSEHYKGITLPSSKHSEDTTPLAPFHQSEDSTAVSDDQSDVTTARSEQPDVTIAPSEQPERSAEQFQQPEVTMTPSEQQEGEEASSQQPEGMTTPYEQAKGTTILFEDTVAVSEQPEETPAPEGAVAWSEKSEGTVTPSVLSDDITTPDDQPEGTVGPSERPDRTTASSEQPAEPTAFSEQSEGAAAISEQPHMMTSLPDQPEGTVAPSEVEGSTTTYDQSESTTAISDHPEDTATPSEQSESTITPSEQSEGTVASPKQPTVVSKLPEVAEAQSMLIEGATASAEKTEGTTSTFDQPEGAKTEQPVETIVPSEHPEETPIPSELLDVTIAQAEETTTLAGEPEGTTVLPEQPDDTAAASEQPEGTMAPSQQPSGTVETSEQYESTEVPSEHDFEVSVTPHDVTSEQPEGTSLSYDQPEVSTEPSEYPKITEGLSGHAEGIVRPHDLHEAVTQQPEGTAVSGGSVTSSEQPQETVTPSNQPEETEIPYTLSEGTIAPSEQPEVTVTPSEQPEGTGVPYELLEETSVPSEKSEGTIEPSDQSEGTVAPSDQPDMTVAPYDHHEGTGVSSEQPEGTTTPSEQIAQTATPSEKSKGTVEPSEQSEGTVTPSEHPEGTVPLSEHPEGTVAPSDDPEGTVAPSEQPEGTVAPAEQPEVTVAPSEQPEVTVSPSEQPDVTVTPSEQPDVTVTPSEHHDGTGVPYEQPEGTATPSEQFVQTATPSEKSEGKIGPSDQSEETVRPSEKLEVTVAPSEQPEVTVAPSEQPEVTVAPSEQPEVTVAPSEQPEVTVSPSEQPDVTVTPSEHHDGTGVPYEQPEGTATPSEQFVQTATPSEKSEGKIGPSDQSEETVRPSEKLEVTVAPSEQPEVTVAPSEQPDANVAPSEHHEGTEVTPEQPEGTPTPSEQPDGTTTPSEQPDGTTTPYEHPDEITTPSEQPDGTTTQSESAQTATPSEKSEGTVEPAELPGVTVAASEQPEGTAAPSEHPEGTVAPSEHPEGTVTPSEHPEGTVAPSEHSEGTVAPSDHPEGTVAPSEHPEGTVTPSEHPEGTVAPSEHSEGTVAPSDHHEGTVAPSEHPEGTVAPSDHPEGTVAPSEHPEGTVGESEHPEETVTTSEHIEGTVASSEHPEGTVASSEHPEGTVEPSEHPEGTVAPSEHPEGTVAPDQQPERTDALSERPEESTELPKQPEGSEVPSEQPEGVTQPEESRVSSEVPSSTVASIEQHDEMNVTSDESVGTSAPLFEQSEGPPKPSKEPEILPTDSDLTTTALDTDTSDKPYEVEPELSSTVGTIDLESVSSVTEPETHSSGEKELATSKIPERFQDETSVRPEAYTSASSVASEDAITGGIHDEVTSTSQPISEATVTSTSVGEMEPSKDGTTPTPIYAPKIPTTTETTSSSEEMDASGEDACMFEGRHYETGQQIPRSDACQFCLCFRRNVLCLRQTCPPPIHGCHEEKIPGFCCPRFQCPMTAVHLNRTTTTTTTTPLPVVAVGCDVDGHVYSVGQLIPAASNECRTCTCTTNGVMTCEPRVCQPNPVMQRLVYATTERVP